MSTHYNSNTTRKPSPLQPHTTSFLATNDHGKAEVGSCCADGGKVRPMLSGDGPRVYSPDRATLAGGDRSGDEGKVSASRYSSELASASGEAGGFVGLLGGGRGGGNGGCALDWRCRFPLRAARFSLATTEACCAPARATSAYCLSVGSRSDEKKKSTSSGAAASSTSEASSACQWKCVLLHNALNALKLG